jgi:hypothetical protein
MSERQTTPGLADVLREVFESALSDLHTACPGKVIAYDAATQTATVEPQIKKALPLRAGGTVLETLPRIQSVPVLHFRSGTAYVHIPIAAGDFVLLVFCERDINEWRRLGTVVDPGDQRMHGLSGAVAIPGLFPSASMIAAPDAAAIEVGIGSMRMLLKPTGLEVGGATDAPASADKVSVELGKIASALSAVANGGGAVTGSNTYVTPLDTAMTMIKAGG